MGHITAAAICAVLQDHKASDPGVFRKLVGRALICPGGALIIGDTFPTTLPEQPDRMVR